MFLPSEQVIPECMWIRVLRFYVLQTVRKSPRPRSGQKIFFSVSCDFSTLAIFVLSDHELSISVLSNLGLIDRCDKPNITVGTTLKTIKPVDADIRDRGGISVRGCMVALGFTTPNEHKGHRSADTCRACHPVGTADSKNKNKAKHTYNVDICILK